MVSLGQPSDFKYQEIKLMEGKKTKYKLYIKAH